MTSEWLFSRWQKADWRVTVSLSSEIRWMDAQAGSYTARKWICQWRNWIKKSSTSHGHILLYINFRYLRAFHLNDNCIILNSETNFSLSSFQEEIAVTQMRNDVTFYRMESPYIILLRDAQITKDDIDSWTTWLKRSCKYFYTHACRFRFFERLHIIVTITTSWRLI